MFFLLTIVRCISLSPLSEDVINGDADDDDDDSPCVEGSEKLGIFRRVGCFLNTSKIGDDALSTIHTLAVIPQLRTLARFICACTPTSFLVWWKEPFQQ